MVALKTPDRRTPGAELKSTPVRAVAVLLVVLLVLGVAGVAIVVAARRRATTPRRQEGRRRPLAPTPTPGARLERAAGRRPGAVLLPGAELGAVPRRRSSARRSSVPVDYTDPGGETIDLALLKVPADDPGQRVGSLVVNPGGPGAPGTSYAENASLRLPATCCGRASTSSASTRVAPASPTRSTASPTRSSTSSSPPTPTRTPRRRAPTTRPNLEDVLRGLRRQLRQPRRPRHHHRGGARHGRAAGRARRVAAALLRRVLRHQARRDVRRPVPRQGRPAGARRCGRPRPSTPGSSASSRPAASRWRCVPTSRTAWTRATASSATPLDDGLTTDPGPDREHRGGAAARPGSDRELDGGQRVLRPRRAALQPRLLVDARPGAPARARRRRLAAAAALADLYESRNEDGTYDDNSAEAIYAINCLDDPYAITADEVPAQIPEFEAGLADLRRRLRLGAGRLPRHPGAVDRAAARRSGPRAPRRSSWSARRATRRRRTSGPCSLADQLESGVLVSRDGDGHTGYNSGNECVDEAIEGYLIDGTVPEDGLEC